MRLVILSLRVVDSRYVLNYNLTLKLTSYFCHQSPTLEVDLPTGKIYLNKYFYLNTGRIYQSPKDVNCFFYVFSYKKPNKKWVLEKLLRHDEQNKRKITPVKKSKIAA